MSMCSCEELEPLLAAYVDGEGTAAQRDTVEGHLARCASCRCAVEHEQTARAALTSCRTRLAAHASPGLRERCQACACSPPSWWRFSRGPGGGGLREFPFPDTDAATTERTALGQHS